MNKILKVDYGGLICSPYLFINLLYFDPIMSSNMQSIGAPIIDTRCTPFKAKRPRVEICYKIELGHQTANGRLA